jgi:hypothetical protein
MERMGMAHHTGLYRLLILGFFDDGFQFSGWPIEQVGLDAARH